MPRLTQVSASSPLVFVYVAITLFGRPFQTDSTNQRIGNSTVADPTTPGPARETFDLFRMFPVQRPVWAISDFARRYFRNRICFLFLQVLRWFTSLGSLPTPMNSVQDCRRSVGRVSPFGNPRINACLQLPEAYRSLPRPSSPACAKASTVRP